MKRTSSLTGVIFPALVAVLPACGDESTCISLELECRGICVDTMTDPSNCGACGRVCSDGLTCSGGACTASCTAPEVECAGACVNTQTSAAHCGACDAACDAGTACVLGGCADPLALLQTSFMDRTIDRDLYVLRDRSFELTKLNLESYPSGTVADHVVLPNGEVLVVAAQDTEGVFELYQVRRGGGRTRLNPPLVAGGDVQPGLAVSGDGMKVLYRADQDVDGVIDLYAVHLATPGVAVKVNGTLTEGGNVSRQFALSADGRRAAYIADQDSLGLNEAYTVDLSGATPGPSVQLNPDDGFAVWDLKMTPDGRKVVLRTATFALVIGVVDTANPGNFDLITNGDGGEGYVEDYQLTADGSAVIYTYAPSFLNASLWRAPLVAPPYDSTRLVDGSGTNRDVRAGFRISPDGAHVYFRQADDASSVKRLYHVAVANPAAITLLSSDAMDGTAQVTDLVLSDDGFGLAYRAGADGAEGGDTRPGTDPPPPFEIVAPDLHYVNLTGGTPSAPVELTTDFDKGDEGVGPGYVVVGGARVLFRADYDTPGNSDVYLGALAEPGTLRKVSPPLDDTTDATDVSIITRY